MKSLQENFIYFQVKSPAKAGGEVNRWILSCDGNKCFLVTQSGCRRAMYVVDRKTAEVLLKCYLWELLPLPGEVYMREGVEGEEVPLVVNSGALDVSP
jgi:hypothetical protein